MANFYSASTRAFYSRNVGDKTLPADAVAIDPAVYATLMAAQDAGKLIQPGPTGPVAVAAPAIAPTAGFTQALRVAFNKQAQAWGFENFVDAASYANSTVALIADEAKALIAWRDAASVSARALLKAIAAGTTPAPATAAAFVTAVLPPAPTQPTS
jgi:hypothetical protein